MFTNRNHNAMSETPRTEDFMAAHIDALKAELAEAREEVGLSHGTIANRDQLIEWQVGEIKRLEAERDALRELEAAAIEVLEDDCLLNVAGWYASLAKLRGALERAGKFPRAALDAHPNNSTSGKCFIAAEGIDDRCPPGECCSPDYCSRDSAGRE